MGDMQVASHHSSVHTD